MFRLNTLGTLELTDLHPAEAAAILAQPKRVAVLLYLALAQPAGWHRRDTLLGLLWGDLDGPRARNALSQALHHLRRGLGTDTLPGQGAEMVRVDPERLSCDAALFELVASSGQHAQALALYQGDLAPGFFIAEAPEFEQWLDGERHRLRDLARGSAIALATGRESAGDVSGAAAALRRAVQFHPEDEGTLRRLMRLLDRDGDRATALRAYEEFVVRLRSDLDVDPSSETQALARALRQPALAPALTTEAPPPPRVVAPLPSQSHSAPPPSPAAGPVSAKPSRRRGQFILLLMVIVLVVGVTQGQRLWNDRPHPANTGGGGEGVAVAPFRLAGADPSLAWLREGMVDLLAVKLSGGGGTRALDPRAVLAAWRGATGSDHGDLTPEDALLVTGRLGARRLVLGGVVGRADRLMISASLRAVPGGSELARAGVEGPADSLPEMVDRLAAQLLALDAGEGEQRLASLGVTSLAALRPYLAGQVAFRSGRYEVAVREYGRALQADSNFTLAALGLAAAGVWVPTGEQARRDALAVAWAGRVRLRPADRAYLIGLAGPRYPAEPTARERLEAWEHAAAIAPDRPDVWYEYGDVLYHKGALLGIGGSWDLARSAFQRAFRLDSTYSAASLHLFEMVTADGDRDAARKLAGQILRTDSTSEHADFVRWRTAVASDDAATRARLRATFGSMSFASLWRIIGTAQLEGVGLDDAALAAAELSRRPSNRDDRVASVGYLAELALNQGHPQEAARLVTELPPDDAARPLIDALYADGDSAPAVATARRLALGERRPLAADSRQRAFQLIDRCALVEWRLWHGDTTMTRTVLRDLRTVTDENAPWWAVGRVKVCAALIDALRAMQGGEVDAGGRLAVLDSVLELGLEVGVREPGNLASARLHEQLGDTAGAIAALKRREYHHRTGIPFLAARLGNLARLSAASGERDAAIAAARQYLALRSAPAPERRARADSVRALLGRLGGTR
jgi:serine/threonine-protein kinase